MAYRLKKNHRTRIEVAAGRPSIMGEVGQQELKYALLPLPDFTMQTPFSCLIYVPI